MSYYNFAVALLIVLNNANGSFDLKARTHTGNFSCDVVRNWATNLYSRLVDSVLVVHSPLASDSVEDGGNKSNPVQWQRA